MAPEPHSRINLLFRYFQKFENENAATEENKKNEYPILRALSPEIANEASAIVACSPNNVNITEIINKF